MASDFFGSLELLDAVVNYRLDSTRQSLDQLVRELQDDKLNINGRHYIYLK